MGIIYECWEKMFWFLYEIFFIHILFCCAYFVYTAYTLIALTTFCLLWQLLPRWPSQHLKICLLSQGTKKHKPCHFSAPSIYIFLSANLVRNLWEWLYTSKEITFILTKRKIFIIIKPKPISYGGLSSFSFVVFFIYDREQFL